ncbi:MAG: MerR family transcriptional regulator [Rhodospirillales bacterium]|nr:MerR family transcriptional regulator [Rhodospirillales bacterium]
MAEPLEFTPHKQGSKSPTAFRTIAEVAEELDLPQHVLRFWESKFPQVRPLKRGGGRRYYRPEDVTVLHRIRSLLHEEGYTIRGAQKLLRQRKAKIDNAEAEPLAVIETPADKNKKNNELESVRDELKKILEELRACRKLLD